MEINCLSIKQPWVWCIFHAGKNVENRTWRSNYRGLLLIHASKGFDMAGYKFLEENKHIYGISKLPTVEELKAESGGLYGFVNMVSCRKNLPNNIWKQENLYGWIFQNPIKLDFVPFKGRLSIFKIELTNTLKKELGINSSNLNHNKGHYKH